MDQREVLDLVAPFLAKLLKPFICTPFFLSATAYMPAYAADEISLNLSKIDAFQWSAPQKVKFGNLTFLGGAVLDSKHPEFAGFSGLHIDDGGAHLLAVSDRGVWLRADILRDKNGRWVSFENCSIDYLRSLSGSVTGQKWQNDAEGLAVKGGNAFVSFERLDHVRIYPADDMSAKPLLLQIDIPEEELRQNEGMEGIAISPEDSALSGAMVAVSEGSINKQGDYFAFILDGAQKGTFFIKPRNNFNITGTDFLPNGDLLLLERRFNFRQGLDIQMRLIKAADIKPNATVDGQLIFEADLSQKIDNLEGMSIWQNEENETIISLISDDNNSFLQSTIYLEFRYEGDLKN